MDRKCFCFTIFVLCPNFGICDPLLVESEDGRLRGKFAKYDDVQYLKFQGIPYAEPPIGELRFKEPQPKKPWLYELDATKEGNTCFQTLSNSSTVKLSEDCLFLNVYKPICNKSSPKPVMVWIHGGEFKALSGSEKIVGPQYFMKRCIIVVTINYRVGALGFLSLGTEEASGNQGLKDVVLALRWIKTNINYFGGDDTKITLAGQGSGSAVVHYMLLTEKTTGLFRNAILQSGSALGYRFFTNTSRDDAKRLAETAGIDTCNEDELLSQLKKLHPADIVRAQEDMGRNDKRKGFRPFSPFVPTTEKKGQNAFITQTPLEIIKNNIPQNVPLIVGFNNREGLRLIPIIRANSTLISYLNEDFQRCVPKDFYLKDGDPVKKIIAENIANFYFGDEINNETLNGYIDLLTDTQFAYPMHNWLQMHKSWNESADVFYYNFYFDGDLNFMKLFTNIDLPGAAHADELGYLFKSLEIESYIDNASEESNRVKDTMVDMWANFVKFNNPMPRSHSPIKWRPIEYPHMNHLVIDAEFYNKQQTPFKNRMKFWQSLYKDQ